MKILDADLDKLWGALTNAGVHKEKNRLRDIVDNVFGKLDVRNKRVLDIGCGPGILSFSASLLGAKEVVGLEPELDGSTDGVNDRFSKIKDDLKVDNVALKIATLQEYDFSDARFDIVIMFNVINHLDEPACMDLHKNPRSRSVYAGIFERLIQFMNPGADLLVSDSSRRNLLGDLGFRNPVAATIEWEKHQQPGQWISVLESVGFEKEFIFWNPLYSLGILRPLFRNGLAAYLSNSHFVFSVKNKR